MKKRVDRKLWGWEDIYALNEKCSVKVLNVQPKQKFSFQRHTKRDEYWRVIEGQCRVWIGKKKIRAKPGDEFYVKRGQLHRVEALTTTAKVLEISFGTFGPHDIERIEDDYGRA